MEEPLQVEVALLRVRLERGELERERLELAAWCGHAAARALVGAIDLQRRREGWRVLVADDEGRARLAASLLALGSQELAEADPTALPRVRAALSVDLDALAARGEPDSEEEERRVVGLSKDLELLAVAEMALRGPEEAVARAWRSLLLRLPRDPGGAAWELPLAAWALGGP